MAHKLDNRDKKSHGIHSLSDARFHIKKREMAMLYCLGDLCLILFVNSDFVRGHSLINRGEKLDN